MEVTTVPLLLLSFLSPSVALLKSLDWVGLNLKPGKIQTGPRSGYPVSRFSLTYGSRESVTCPTGLSIPEAITMTFSFFRSDKLVYTNSWLRPISPCQPTQAMAGPVFSYLLNPHPTFPGRDHEFYGCL